MVKVDLGYKTLTFCQINHQGQLVKHGPEESTDGTGKVIEQKNYRYGVETKAQFNSTGLPAISEKHKDFADNDHRTVASEAVKMLFKALLPFFGKGSNGNFIVSGCPDYHGKWLQILVFKTPQNLPYQFASECHIQGTVSYSKTTDISFNLDLKGLAPFAHVTMNVKCSTAMNTLPPLVDIDCSTENGVLSPLASAPNKGETHFKANYAVTINPQLKKLIHMNKGGKISFSQIFGMPETYEATLFINESSL